LSYRSINNFFLRGNDFHKIENFIQAKDKIFEFQVCSKSFFYSNIQLLFFSKFCFEMILQTNRPFIIDGVQLIDNQDLLNCFSLLYSLLSSSESISISLQNVTVYKYFSNILQNQTLSLVCDEVELIEKRNFLGYHQFVLTNLMMKFKTKLIISKYF
jgi:hypothetical protein